MQTRQQAADRQRALHFRGQRSRREVEPSPVRPTPAPAGHRQARPVHRPALPAHRPARLRSAARARLRPRFPSPLRPAGVRRRGRPIQPRCLSQPPPRPAPARARHAAGFPARPADRVRPAPACAARPVRPARALLFLQPATACLRVSTSVVSPSSEVFWLSCCGCSLANASSQRLQVKAGTLGGQCSRRRSASRICRSRYSMRVRSTSPARVASDWSGYAHPSAAASRQARFGIAQCFLAALVVFLQLRQPRLGVGHRFAQHVELRSSPLMCSPISAKRVLRFVARALQALAPFRADAAICCSIRASVLPTW